MARRFSTASDRVESNGLSDGSAIPQTPVDRSFTWLGLVKRTGGRDNAAFFACENSSSGWALACGAGADNGKFGLVLRGVAALAVDQTLTLDTTMAVAVRWEDGVRVDYWTQAEGAGGATKTGATSGSTLASPPAGVYYISFGNFPSNSGINAGFIGDIQYGGIVEGLLTDTEVTDTLSALLAGDMTAINGFDERFAMHLSPGGVATDPEDDTSPNDQDSTLITGTTAVADLVAAGGGGPTFNPAWARGSNIVIH